jgi:hypothetical protein
MSILLFIFTTICITGDAHAEFDKFGNYVCNPFNTGLETNIYTSTVNQINYKMDSYLNAHPNATLEQQHDVLIQDQKTWDLYNKSKQCIDSLGVNPDKVASLSYKVNQAIAVPEFGPVAGMVIAISIVSVVIISRKASIF